MEAAVPRFLLLPHLLFVLSSRPTSGQLIKTNGLLEPNLFRFADLQRISTRFSEAKPAELLRTGCQ